MPRCTAFSSALAVLAGASGVLADSGVPADANATGASFITLGDWGGASLGLNALGKLYVHNVKAVAAQMADTAKDVSAQFIVNTGDNFYWCGISNTSDFQIKTDWVDPYKALPEGLKWYSVLGNHEYGYNVTAQLDLAAEYDTWVMDSRYYTKRVRVGAAESADGSATNGTFVQFIFLDTSPCITEYRSSNNKGWDPCGSEYPTCSLAGGSDEGPGGPCRFNPNILTQNCGTQYEWFQQQLAKVNKDDWLIVVGHHPAEEMDVEGTDFVAAMQSHGGVDLYLNGHAHTLSHYQIDNKGAYITSGAGALVRSGDDTFVDPHHHHHDDDDDDEDGSTMTPGKLRTLNKTRGVDVAPNTNGHSYHVVYNERASGFTSHTFSADYTKLTSNFVDTAGKIGHTFTVTRGSTPGPAPPSTGSCKEFGCGKYVSGQSCQCNDECTKYENCCSDYKTVCK